MLARLTVSIALLAAAGAWPDAAQGQDQSQDQAQSQDQGQAQGQDQDQDRSEGAPVRVDAVRSEPLAQTVPVIGRLVARRSGVVSARINGPVNEVLVEVGDRIEAGQVLARLDATVLQARRTLSAAELAEATATRKARVAARDLARQELKRQEGLRSSAAFNKSRLDEAVQQLAMAEAQIAEAAANAQTYDVELRLADINLYNAEVRALYDGVVTERMTEAGAYVQVGDPILSMIADRTLEIEADVPFRRLSGLPPGTAVSVRLDDGTAHEAVVRAAVPQENPLTRTRAVRFIPAFGTTEKPLAGGQSVTVLVPSAAPRQAVTVHKDAVIKRGPEAIVYVAAEGTAELRPVRLGDAVGSRLEVLGGLAEGDLVVVRGNERLRPGDSIVIEDRSR